MLLCSGAPRACLSEGGEAQQEQSEAITRKPRVAKAALCSLMFGESEDGAFGSGSLVASVSLAAPVLTSRKVSFTALYLHIK